MSNTAYWIVLGCVLLPFVLLDALSFGWELGRLRRRTGPSGVPIVSLIVYLVLLGQVAPVLVGNSPSLAPQTKGLLGWLVVFHVACHGTLPVVLGVGRWMRDRSK